MKILLVRPRPEKETIGLQHVMIVEPMELEVIGALVRPQDQVIIVDMIIEKRSIEYYIKKHQPDMVGLTGYITNVGTINHMCSEIKSINPEIVTVVGGVHCEVCPEDFNDPMVDFRVVRNAVTVFPKLLDHIDGKSSLPKGIFKYDQQIDWTTIPPIDFNYVVPDRSLTDKYRDKYFYIFHEKVALLKASFGCPFTCNFCFCREITGRQYHQRPIENVIDELSQIEQNEIYIVDDDFLADPEYVENFLNQVESRHIKKRYLLYGRSDFIVRHPKLMARFYTLGLRTVIVGFESFFDEELEKFQKNIDVKTNIEAMHILNDLNIDCYATIILSPEWGRDEFRRLEKFLKELKIHFVNLQPLTPLPGTDFKVSEDQLLIKKDDYAKWDLAHISVRPVKLTVFEYYRELLQLYERVLFQTWILKKHLKNRPFWMLVKMIIGTRRVHRQYRLKVAEAGKEFYN